MNVFLKISLWALISGALAWNAFDPNPCHGASNVIYQAKYDPFGEVFFETGPLGGEVDYTFTGQEWDDALTMLDYGARYYQPFLGRFLSTDPVDHHGESPYAYVHNNPLRYIDPTGNQGREAQDHASQKIRIVIVKSALSEIGRHTTDYLVKVDAGMAARSGGSAAQTGQVLRATGTLFSFVVNFGLSLASGESPEKAALKTAGLIGATKLLGAPGLAVGALYLTIEGFVTMTRDISERMKLREEGYISVVEWGGGNHYYVIHYGTELTKENEKAALEAAKSEFNALLEKDRIQREKEEKKDEEK